MRDPIAGPPEERGEVTMSGRCQVCGATGETIALPDKPPPNQVCAKCAIDYSDTLAADDDEGAPA